MADIMNTRGVSTNEDLSPNLIRRETRPLRQRMREIVNEHGGIFMAIFGILMISSTSFADIIFFAALLFWLYAKKQSLNYKFRTPVLEFEKKKKQGKGVFFLGNDKLDSSGLWFTDSDMRTHMLVFGSTGSGKTRFLLGLLYQAMLVGSGAMYVDGKADNTVYWLVYSLCRRLGREDDLLVINYLTGSEDVSQNKGLKGRLSNTTNPFAYGTPDQLRSLIVGLMRDSGGDGDMWKGRASALLGGVLRCLVHMRNSGEIQLSVSTIREFLPLDRVLELTRRNDFPENAQRPLKQYLFELPGYNESDAQAGDLAAKCYEQHGYLTMQLTETLGDLGETYGHIFSVPLGEVDFKDVVFNRRILFVMLPTLEKDPDALANLGKLVVAGIRSALAPALGNKLEGRKREVIDVKPTNSPVPFLLILDEYGYYSVKGFAAVAAQARSLGVSVVFAGQDYPSFKKGSEEEAASTVANTNIKIAMKLEDPNETFDVMEKRAGKSQITTTSGHEVKGMTMNYQDQLSTRIEEKARIDIRDLVSQTPGEAHVIFGDTLVRAKLFAVLTKEEDKKGGVHEIPSSRLNQFLMVKGPSKNLVESLNGTFEKLDKLFSKGTSNRGGGGGKVGGTEVNPEIGGKPRDSMIKNFISDFKNSVKKGQDYFDASITSIGMVEYRNKLGDEELASKAHVSNGSGMEETQPSGNNDGDAATTLAKEDNFDLDEIFDDGDPFSNNNGIDNKSSGSNLDLPDIYDETPKPSESSDNSTQAPLNTQDTDPFSSDSLINQDSEQYANMFSEVISSVVESNLFNNGDITSLDERIRVNPHEQLKEIERRIGRSEDEAELQAKAAIQQLNDSTQYPVNPVPKKQSEEIMNDSLQRLNDFIERVESNGGFRDIKQES